MNEVTKINPADLMRQETDIASTCKDIVTKTAVNISGKKHVCVEGWSSIAIAHGCVLSARDVKKEGDGFTAVGEVKRITDGLILATGEGYCGRDEDTWADRPEYALRAMAQTRAQSRAARTCFSHIVVMIDGNLQTTPAEEVSSGGFERKEFLVCPSCGKSTVIKGKEEYGGGYICWKKQGGCGAKFTEEDFNQDEKKNPDWYEALSAETKLTIKGYNAKAQSKLSFRDIENLLQKTFDNDEGAFVDDLNARIMAWEDAKK